ncbi:MAG: hypothetical protein ACREO8_06595 [Luteimonas sp.]
MPTPAWQPGRLYLPGALVVPRTAPAPQTSALANPGAEDGTLGGWDRTITGGAGVPAVRTDRVFTGTYCFRFNGGSGNNAIECVWLNQTAPIVQLGNRISASASIALDDTGNSANRSSIRLYWFSSSDGTGAPISFSDGNVLSGNNSSWRTSTVTGAAPPNAASVRVGVWTRANNSGGVRFDQVVWDYNFTPTAGLIYKAVQPAAGLSDSTEPTWPLILGVQIIDNQVIWEAVVLSRVVWQAVPLLISGDTEPVWPETNGGYVADGTIKWRTSSRRVEDVKCPNSKVVVILASKVFAADKDIVRFCATANPLDWTSADNAGYLATGLQQANGNDMEVLNQYRGNLVALNASSFQNWQVDPDPAAMAILDQMDGIGSTWQQAAQPVANELLYLSHLGVRSVGLSAANNSLAAGDVGMPVDPLVQAAIRDAIAREAIPVSTYYPSQGQYWLAFPGYPTTDVTTVFVFTMNGGTGKWSQYLFPFAIEAFAQLGDDLYIRNGEAVSLVSEDAIADDIFADGVSTVEFGGMVWWHYLDFGQPGVTKMLQGVDVVASGTPSISIGYDQRDLAMFTAPYEIPADTLPGGMIPLPVSAPTMSVKLDFASGQRWSMQAVNLIVSDFRAGV